MKIVDAILFLWQLPQNIIGWIVCRYYKIIGTVSVKTIDGITVYDASKFDGAVSLGSFIIVGSRFFSSHFININQLVAHESGHQKQSRMLGWFYLLVVGIPSAIRNIYATNTMKDDAWYYGHYPENWADKLGKVKRFS